ncbi:3-oxoacyl-[acyl-carrier-protein] reductase [Wickerhamomyces ciferrii]|uniref:3-oxoacyl-[acyl-carrier-protein] reductase n=1 Tax=Wickerhamomyces ciferrii (strain ATCC 14091 / BCRC 22168 / CBS 111 / JCM 3599 / NBRC 0793 / NRRL Y-1031 F-60-10) TaxID=1206466 RepID=K0KBX2_WICCF|nr:3-oxoacyl-[acyl-carrier-protein] reductase [Wickerhamomyces ciferrii]CCH42565.1 3-oxoacyl-[acyl-carrier-protein] reductase [Wickerhamomyces ciferrii]
MSGKVYFISGANRGIGYEFAKQLSSISSNTVIATARDPSSSSELQQLSGSNSNVHAIKLDVSDEKSFEQLDDQLKDIAQNGIDVLISNAGIAQSYKSLLETPKEKFINHFNVNAVGPILLVKALYKYLQKSQTKHIAFVSSLAGSINEFIPFSTSAYGQSKAALNYAVKEFSFELESEGFTVIALHPGVVSTDMFNTAFSYYEENVPAVVEVLKDYETLTSEESAKRQLKTITNLSKEQNGKFYDENGKEVSY